MTEMTETANNLGEITYTRVYDAPRELVFKCMTTPEHLAHFWGPKGASTPLDKIIVELHAGGRFETTMVDDASGAEYPMSGVFVEVAEPSKLVWSEANVEGGMTTSVTFNDLGDGRTETVAHQTNVPEMYRTADARTGMESSFDRFAAYLATL
jgi:uncharacterized protein YndB with AHSA1/START domain